MVSDTPRPPRRVPPGAGDGTALRSRTTIEARPGAGAEPGRGPVRPPRPWYLIPVVLAVLAAGAGVGWLAREQADGELIATGFDPDNVLKSVGPAVVRVHASTCATKGLVGGTGRATGVFVDPDTVLTVATAIKNPVAVAIETADGRVRDAQVEGVDKTGVAVLRVYGDPLGLPIPELAASTPAGTDDVPVVGFGDDDTQTVELHAVTRSTDGSAITGTSGLLPAGYAGAPVLDRQGHAIGLVTRTGPNGATAIGLPALRQFQQRSRQLAVAQLPTGCTEGKGPQSAVVPAMDGPSGPLATESRELLGRYVTAINRHDVTAVLALFTGKLADRTWSEMREQYRWEALFGTSIRVVSADGDGAQVQMTQTSLQRPGPGEGEYRCRRYDVTYGLSRVDGKLKIDYATPTNRDSQVPYRSCTGD